MKVDNLARAIERDLLAERPKSTPRCRLRLELARPRPRVTTAYGPCSAGVSEAYDAGFPSPRSQVSATKGNQRQYALPLGREGFKIDCAGCGKRFDSSGAAVCCSIECERGLGQKRETERLKVEAGIEFVQARPQAQVPDVPGQHPTLAQRSGGGRGGLGSARPDKALKCSRTLSRFGR